MKKKSPKLVGIKRDIPMRNVTMIEVGAGVVLIAVLLLLYVWYVNGLSTFKSADTTYQYNSGQKIEYVGGTSFRNADKTTKSVVAINNNEGTASEVLHAPLISENEEQIYLTLTSDMELMVPEEGTALSRILTFTKVSCNNKRITYEKDKKKAQSYGGFLYDGSDLYIFLEDTTLKIGEKSYDLGPMSFARVSYNNQIEFFNSKTREDKVIGLGGAQVIAETDTYKLNLGGDIVYIGPNEYILYPVVSEIYPIEMER